MPAEAAAGSELTLPMDLFRWAAVRGIGREIPAIAPRVA